MVGLAKSWRVPYMLVAAFAATMALLLGMNLRASAMPLVVHVNPSATGAEDGTSWADAYVDLQTAIDKTADAGGGQIWVRSSNYSPGTSATDSFVLADNVELYGGFIGNETMLAQRDWLNFATLLTGGGTNHHVVQAEGTSNTRVDGFVIDAGVANGAATDDQNGAGYYGRGATDAVIANVAFEANVATNKGGAIFVDDGASLSIVNVGFYSNFADDANGPGNGGAMFVGSNADVEVINSYFFNNNADGEGGAIFNAVADVSVLSSTFRSNFATSGVGDVIRNNTAGGTVGMKNSIVWNAGASASVISGTVAVDFSNIDGGFVGTGNINADPLFTVASQPFIALNSPVVNVGTNGSVPADTFDVDDDGDTAEPVPTLWRTDRIRGPVVEMGAVEVVCAETVFVDATSTAGLNEDGGTWTTAFTDLQDGLQLARDCAPWVTEVHVANGTYKPHPSDPDVSFELVDGVTIIGGFSNGGSVNPSRPVNVWQTILEGDLQNNDPSTGSVVNAAHTDPQHPNRVDNSKRVVVADSVTAGLQNVRVNGGNANFGLVNGGAGILADSAQLTLRRVQVTENTATNLGAGVNAFFGATVNIIDSELLSNHSEGSAGALDVNSSLARIVMTEIADNSAGNGGGAIRTLGGDLTIENTEIVRNTADEGGALHLRGAGTVKIINSTIASNAADTKGGAVEIDETLAAEPSFALVNSIVWGNDAPTNPNLDTEALLGLNDFNIVEGGAPGTDNLDVDPRFTGPPSLHRIGPDSPAMNSGDNGSAPTDDLDVDQDGDTGELAPVFLLFEDRIKFGTVDRGAWESNCPTTSTLYVDLSATGNDSGESWANAYLDLQTALRHARNCSDVDTINVAKGTYIPDPTDETVSFELVDGVDVIGGFPAGGSATPDPAANETILSGDLLGNDNDNLAPSEATRDDNSMLVVKVSNGVDVGLRGVTVSGADEDTADPLGAAILVELFSTLDARDLLVVDNVVRGGVVEVSASQLVLNRAEVTNNWVPGSSPGMFSLNLSSTVADVSHVHVHHNTQKAFSVGSGAMLRLSNALIHDQSGFSGAALRIGGTAIVDSSTIIRNTRTFDGGAAGVETQGLGTADIRNSIIRGNLIDDSPAGSGVPGDIDGANITISFSNIEGGFAGLGNIDADPDFVDPVFDDFRLRIGSPSIDKGDNALLPADYADVDDDGDVAEQVPLDFAGAARIQATITDQGAFEGGVPLDGLTVLPTACVIYDSTAAAAPLDGPFTGNETRTLQVSGALSGQGGHSLCVPSTASAVVYTISALDPQGAGNLRLSEEGVVPNGGVVNYTSNGLNNANTVTVPLGATGKVDVTANNNGTGVRLVALGYYSPSGDLRYTELTPCAVADTRPTQGAGTDFEGPFAAGTGLSKIDVVGTFPAGQGGGNTDCGVPASADAVVINVVSVQGSGGTGFLSAGPFGSIPQEPTTPFAAIGLNNATATVVPLDGGELVSVLVGAVSGAPSSHIRVVVLGYLGDAGADYVPVNPCAAFDSRTTIPGDTNVPTGVFAGKRVAGATGAVTYDVTGAIPAAQGGELDCAVPDGVSAVLVNLVAIQPDAVGNLRAFATGSSPTGGVLNFAPLTPVMNNSNAVVVPVDGSGQLDIFTNAPSNDGNPTVHVRGVILGYYE